MIFIIPIQSTPTHFLMERSDKDGQVKSVVALNSQYAFWLTDVNNSLSIERVVTKHELPDFGSELTQHLRNQWVQRAMNGFVEIPTVGPFSYFEEIGDALVVQSLEPEGQGFVVKFTIVEEQIPESVVEKSLTEGRLRLGGAPYYLPTKINFRFKGMYISVEQVQKMIDQGMTDKDGNLATLDMAGQLPDVFINATWSYADREGIPYVSSFEILGLPQQPSRWDVGRFTSINWKDKPHPRNQLRLTHYGFPEPPGVRWGMAWWLRVVIVGMLLIVAGVVVKRFVKSP